MPMSPKFNLPCSKKTSNTTWFVIYLLFVFSIIPSGISYSQVNTDSQSLPEKFPQIQEQLDITVTPQTPKPGDIVNISVESYDLNLNSLLLNWRVNGKEQLNGLGQKKFSFTLGQAGEKTIVDLAIKTNGGSIINKSFQFTPVNVDLLWQANTYTPPFYKGKALYTPEANVMFVAIPNIISGGSRVSPSNVVYTWKQNYDVQGSLSGFGKNTFNFDGPIFIRSTIIEATAYAANDQSLKGSGEVSVTPQNPLALIYEDNPLLGVLFNKNIGSFTTLKGLEIKMAAYPYFFSTPSKNSTVTYTWALNTSPIDLPFTQNSIILRRTDGKPGQSVVSVGVTEDSKILQESSNSFIVDYEN